MRIMVIAAHPDDEILGCGGSIANWSKKGHEVNTLILAEGATSRDDKRDTDKRKEDLLTLSSAANKACKILGAKSVDFLNYPDNRLDSIDILDIIKKIEKKVAILQPDTIITHHAGDLNIDHQIVNQAVVTACRPLPTQTVRRILSFEIPSSTEWQSPTFGIPFIPNWFEDITNTLELKLEAIKIYGMELCEWPHPRSTEAIESLAKVRGSSVGVSAAEAFMLIRELHIER